LWVASYELLFLLGLRLVFIDSYRAGVEIFIKKIFFPTYNLSLLNLDDILWPVISFIICVCVCVVLGFEFRISCLLGRCSTA
jgi:hypothetical protein